MSKLLSRLLQDSQSGNHVDNAIRTGRLREEQEVTENYVWDKHVHPSSLSFDMCLETYFASVDKHEAWQIDNLYKARRGTIIHQEIQEDIVKIPGFLYDLPQNLPFRLRSKFFQIWPEVPVFDEPSGIKGQADFVMNLRGRPVPVDIKTTSAVSKWKNFNKEFPTERQKCQVGVYTYLMRKCGYYSILPEEFGFYFILVPEVPGAKGSIQEVYIKYSEVAEKVEYLVEDLMVRHFPRKLSREAIVCDNKYCPTHGLKVSA